jgi:hypothetical protein
MPRRKKETLSMKIAPHVIPAFVGVSFFLSLFVISVKVYSDNTTAQYETHVAHIEQPPLNDELLARIIHWDKYEDQKHQFSVRYPGTKLKNTNDAPLFAKAGLCSKKEVQALTLEPVQFDTESLPTEIYANLVQFTVHTEPVTERISPEDWFQKHCSDFFYDPDSYTKETVTVHGVEGIRITERLVADETPYKTKKMYTFLQANNRIYILTSHYSFENDGDEQAVRHAERILQDITESITFE